MSERSERTTITGDLADAVRTVAPAASRDRKAPAALRGVLVERAGDVVRAVATDRHRLMVCERPAGDAPHDLRVLVDPETLAAATGVEDFPAYERFLEAVPGTVSATVDAGAFLADVEAEADDDAPIAVQVAEGRVRVGAQVDAPTLHVDARYLHDAIEAVGTAELVVEATTERAPLVLRTQGLVTLVMPVLIAAGRRS